MNIPIDRHVPAVAEPIAKAQPTNYADILKELERDQQQASQQQPVVQQQQAPPPPAQAPQPPVPVSLQPPQPVVRFAEPLVQSQYRPSPPEKPLPVDKGPLEDSFFVRYRRHLFVAAVAFIVLHYATPYMGSVSYLSNGLVRSAATATLIAGLFYAGDLFILSPETIVEVAR